MTEYNSKHSTVRRAPYELYMAFVDMSNFKKGWAPGGKRTLTRDFYAYLEAQPLLKAVLAGHIHVTVADRFSPTAVEYVVGGNFLFHGQEITIS